MFLAGAATLFVELALIRYVPGQIRVLGYFTNFVLLAAFLGFGLGILAQRRWPERLRLGTWAPFALLAVVGLAELGTMLRVLPSPEDFLFLEYRDHGFKIPMYPFLAGSFLLLALSFMPLGYVVGQTLEGDRPLIRYGLNVAGSLLGIALFALFSAFAAPPWLWMAMAGVFTLIGVLEASLLKRAASLVFVAVCAVTVAFATRGTIWSPYQKLGQGPIHILPERVVQEWKLPSLSDEDRAQLKTLPLDEGFTVRVNDDSYQTPVNLSHAQVAKWPGLRPLRLQYDLPFKLEAKRDDVLVLGAGTGNDVAGALRAGVGHVDAVEIDPEIYAMGALHGEKPYSDPRVTVHIADARSFLAHTDKKFDEIVYGLVDSHVLINARSPVRLDSFVFTKESFALARQRLKSGGVLLLSHAVGMPWFYERMRKTLAEAFDKPPQIVTGKIPHPLGIVYAAGDSLPPGDPVSEKATVLEDDWPFVYLKDQKIPSEYLIAMLIVAVASVLGVRAVTGKGFRGLSGQFFFLGAGFLLLETRGLTVLAVHLGSTWSVNAAVFAGVLTMALLATWVGHRISSSPKWTKEPPWLAYALLGVFLVINYVVPMGWLAGLPFAARAVLGSLIISLPLFASGVIYALSLARTQEADRALAANLFGAMMGGLVEYISMITGFRALVLLGAMFYMLAMLFDLRSRKPAAAATCDHTGNGELLSLASEKGTAAGRVRARGRRARSSRAAGLGARA